MSYSIENLQKTSCEYFEQDSAPANIIENYIPRICTIFVM
jgi:hypothetical protein